MNKYHMPSKKIGIICIVLMAFFGLQKPAHAFSPVPVQCSIAYARYWQMPFTDLAGILRGRFDRDGECAGEAMMDKYPAQAIPMLLTLLKHSSAQVRVMAVSALGQPSANKQRDKVLPALISDMADPDDHVLDAAINSLKALGFSEKDEKVVKAMLGSIESGRQPKYMAASALANASSLPIIAIARLARLTKSARDDPNMRVLLLRALTKTGSPEAAAIVADNLLTPDNYSEYDALRAMAEMQETSVPSLTRIYPDASLQIQIGILNTLKEIDASVARDAVHRFLPGMLQRAGKLIGAPKLEEKRKGFVILENLGVLVRPALPTLIASLSSPDETIRSDAADALRDSELVEALPQLRRVADNDSSKHVRQEAELAVDQITSAEKSRKTLEACISTECEERLGAENVRRTRAKMLLREELKKY